MPDTEFPQRTWLTLTRCSLDATGKATLEEQRFSAPINPAEVSFGRNISYSNQKVIGQLGSDLRFSGIQPEKLGFSLVLDGTGAGPVPPQDVAAQLRALLAVVYRHDTVLNEPSRVQLVWGGLCFYGRLTALQTQYTLFKPNGDPLRARLKLDFSRFLSAGEAVLEAGTPPAQASQVVEPQRGETLPEMCQRVYGDPSYAAGIAHLNGLSSLGRVPAKSQLVFPPLPAR